MNPNADLARAIRAYRATHNVPRTHDVEAWRSSDGVYEVSTRTRPRRAFRREQQALHALQR